MRYIIPAIIVLSFFFAGCSTNPPEVRGSMYPEHVETRVFTSSKTGQKVRFRVNEETGALIFEESTDESS